LLSESGVREQWGAIFSEHGIHTSKVRMVGTSNPLGTLQVETPTYSNDEVAPRFLSPGMPQGAYTEIHLGEANLRFGRGRYKLYHPLLRLFLKEK
jgi:hypothetical protein